MKDLVIWTVWFFALVLAGSASEPARFDIKPSEESEALIVISNINHCSLAYQAATVQRMLAEANYVSGQLGLPTPHPIQMGDVRYPYVSPPWPSMIKDNSFPYFSTNINREKRLRAIKISVAGTIETTNFFFSFKQGKVWEIERLGEHEVEYYAKDLGKLIGKPSLITDAQAHDLATQWLAAVDVDVAALEKAHPPEINHLRYLPRNSTNVLVLPYYFIHWGWQHYTNGDGVEIGSEPLVQVEILGATKEFVELNMLDTSFSRRPLLILTNALDLIRTPNPPLKRLQRPLILQTNSIGTASTNAPRPRPPPFHIQIQQ